MMKKNKNDKQNMSKMTRVIDNKTIHCKSIIDGLLYDTSTSELLCNSGGCAYFKTKNGRYFCCDYENFADTYYDVCEDRWRYGFQEIYASINPISESEVRQKVGIYNVEKYIELFGEPEEA